VEHEFKGERTETGINEGRRWRHGSRFQYTLDTHGESVVDIEVTYWGGDRGRKFDILVNSKRISSEELKGSKPGEFFAKRYSIPESIIKAASNGRVTVKFVATQWLAGGVYDIRLLRSEK